MEHNQYLFNPSYIGERPDIVQLIPRESLQRILDVGCSTGMLGATLKQHSQIEVVGIEANEAMATLAKKRLDRVICADVETLNFDACFERKYFTCIVFADILEHLKDPWTVLRQLVQFLHDEGTVVASIPNVGHYSTAANLILRQRWLYSERGILDKNHLRFFTLESIHTLFNGASLCITTFERNYRLLERPHWINAYAKYCSFGVLKDLLTFQYIVAAHKKTGNAH
jgi:SAM-dependent methyltransferase